MSGMALTSIQCVAHVIGLDVRNGSAEHSVYSLRDWDRCYARMFQRAVCSYIYFVFMENFL